MTTSQKNFKHIQKFACVCEVGTFRRGLDDANISLKDILRKPFGESVCCAAAKNYEGMWNFGGAFHGTTSLRGDRETFHVPGERDIDAVIAPFVGRRPSRSAPSTLGSSKQ